MHTVHRWVRGISKNFGPTLGQWKRIGIFKSWSQPNPSSWSTQPTPSISPLPLPDPEDHLNVSSRTMLPRRKFWIHVTLIIIFVVIMCVVLKTNISMNLVSFWIWRTMTSLALQVKSKKKETRSKNQSPKQKFMSLQLGTLLHISPDALFFVVTTIGAACNQVNTVNYEAHLAVSTCQWSEKQISLGFEQL